MLICRRQQTVNRFILDPKNAEFLSLIKSARNGIVYGTKIRFPHALVYGLPALCQRLV